MKGTLKELVLTLNSVWPVDFEALANLEVQALRIEVQRLTLRLGFTETPNKDLLIRFKAYLQEYLALPELILQMRPLEMKASILSQQPAPEELEEQDAPVSWGEDDLPEPPPAEWFEQTFEETVDWPEETLIQDKAPSEMAGPAPEQTGAGSVPEPFQIAKEVQLNTYQQTEALARQRLQERLAQKATARPKISARPGREQEEGLIWGRTPKNVEDISLLDLSSAHDVVRFVGRVFDLDSRLTKNEKTMIKFAVTDESNSVNCVMFCTTEEAESLIPQLKGAYLCITADLSFDDRYEHDYSARVRSIAPMTAPEGKKDLADKKRVELHIHSKMSAKDATSNPADIVKRAADYGHAAIALTDHGVVQGFPEAANMQRALKKKGKDIKLIYGMEGYLVDDGPCLFFHLEALSAPEQLVSLTFTQNEERICSYEARLWQLDESRRLTELELLSWTASVMPSEEGFYAEHLREMQKLATFMKGKLLLCEHTWSSLSILRRNGYTMPVQEPRTKFNPPVVDWEAFQKFCGFEAAQGRSSMALAVAFADLWRAREESSYEALNEACGWRSFTELKRTKQARRNHIIILAQSEVGMYNLYRLVSASHLNYFYFKPCIPRSLLSYFRSDLILGSACVYGEIFWGVLQHYLDQGQDYERAKAALANSQLPALAAFYDYLEIQPLCNNDFLLHRKTDPIMSQDGLIDLNRLVVDLADQQDRMVCATCDSHFIDPKDAIYRQIILADMGMEDAEQPAPLFFRNTLEMLEEFSYLPEARRMEIVVDNPNRIAERVEADLLPFPDGSFPPLIASADREVEELTYQKALASYGRDGRLPELIQQRLERELNAIISNGYAVMYYIAHKLVKRSNDDGYVVGSRGSVGSSLVATFCGITEVNPLPPHYVCPHCHYFEVEASGKYGSGFDLAPKACPECGSPLLREGQDIPFETFLGFNGDKQPDIDLNFSGLYQATAHEFIEEMFGKTHTFRAGTISAYADKNSFNMVKHYVDEHGEDLENGRVGMTEIKRLSLGIQGVKVTTGQHPGGIVVVPKEREVYDFTPVQRPADKSDINTVTTHFDFNAMHDTILKLDILGHDDPTMLKMLGDNTGVKISDIPIPDERVMSLFQTTAAIGINPEQSTIQSATIGLPEVGTMMAREMISETKPTQFYDLVQLSGLSHGTDVWKGNAQELIRKHICTINDVIGCRDSIMTSLIYYGLPNRDAFNIMEKVRKGKGLSEDHEQLMRDHQVPDWYIESCKKIKYMFPKAHAAAYTISMLRIAYFKVYYPEAYYSAFFTVRADEFTAEDFLYPPERIAYMRAEKRKHLLDMDKAAQKKFYILELVEEMQTRGIDFLPIDLAASRASEFYSPEKGKIRPPFNILNGISTAQGEQIVAARADGPFPNCEELQRRTHLGQAALETLRQAGVLGDMPESAQMDLFSLLG